MAKVVTLPVPRSVTELVSSISEKDAISFEDAAWHATELLRLSLVGTLESKKRLIIAPIPPRPRDDASTLKAACFQALTVVETVRDPDTEISFDDAVQKLPTTAIGRQLYESIPINVDHIPLFHEYLGERPVVQMKNFSLIAENEST